MLIVLNGVVAFLSLMLQGIRGLAAALFSLPFAVKFVAPWLVGVLFLAFNSPAIYGDGWQSQQTALLIYIAALALALSIKRAGNPLLTSSTGGFLVTFLSWGALGVIVFNIITPLQPAPAFLTTASIGILVTHILVVAIGEELLFRFVIPSFIPGPAIVAQAVSAVAFGFTHWFAYGGDVPSMLFAAVLGLVFGTIVVLFPRQGLIAAMGLHAGWNAVALGFA